MQNLVGWMVLGVALVAGLPAVAQSVSCTFRDSRNELVEVNLTAEMPLMPRFQSITSGIITFKIKGLIPLTLPAAVNPADPESKFEVKNGELISANVTFNQGHQSVRITSTSEGRSIYLELPYGLMGGGTITSPCLGDL